MGAEAPAKMDQAKILSYQAFFVLQARLMFYCFALVLLKARTEMREGPWHVKPAVKPKRTT